MKSIISKFYHVVISTNDYYNVWLITSSLSFAKSEAYRISSDYPVGSVFVSEVIETREVVFKTW